MLWFEKLIVRFFMSIDTVLFNFIATLYDLLIAISRTSILSQGDITSFVVRIEVMLGIFMLFKVSFSLITYIVNPDDFSDSSKGFGKLIQNSVISLVLLVMVPYIFQLAFNLQSKILDDNILAKLLLGEKINDDSGNGATIIDTAGEQMAFYVMLPFFSPNYSVKDLSGCINMLESDGSFSSKCESALKEAGLDSPDLDNYTNGIKNKSLGLTFRTDTAVALTKEAEDEGDKADQHFVIAYQKPLSTVTAVVICLLLISFCIDVGVRSVKLAFLQLIYPVPVISYMDPKSGQDGMFTKWYKMCLSTFLSLFIRLLALYFGIYIISKVSDLGVYDIINGSQITNGWVKIFVIIGVLMFVKQLPKILENMGFKLEGDGKFNLNPLKKLEEGAVGGKMLSRAPKAAAGAAMGLGMGAVGAATGAGIGKGISGMFSGAAAGLKGKKMGEIHKGQIDANQRMREARANGSTFFGRMGTRIGDFSGSGGKNASLQSADKKLENEMKTYEEAHKSFDDLKSKLVGNIKGGKAPDVIKDKYNSLRANVEAKKSLKDGISRDDYYDQNGKFMQTRYENDVNNASKALIDAENALSLYENKTGVEDYYKMYRGESIIDLAGNSVEMTKEERNKVKNEFDQFDQIASQRGVDVRTYAAADQFDTDNVNQIAKKSRDRQRIREERERATADKSGIGK